MRNLSRTMRNMSKNIRLGFSFVYILFPLLGIFLLSFVAQLFISFCRVLGQVSCELVPPKPNRATEGILFCNLELSPMAAPGFEPGRYVAFSKVRVRITYEPVFWHTRVCSIIMFNLG